MKIPVNSRIIVVLIIDNLLLYENLIITYFSILCEKLMIHQMEFAKYTIDDIYHSNIE